MLFNSIDFWVFFGAVVLTVFGLPRRARPLAMLVASALFYMRWNALYIVLIAISGTVDYVAGRLLGSRSLSTLGRRAVLFSSLATNLGILFTFKYWSFFHTSMASLLAPLGVAYSVADTTLLLPVGISFYTFQTMSYTVDLYRGDLDEPERDPVTFALYVLYFPQLVAGPIERAGRLLEQLRRPPVFEANRFTSGLQLALWGLFKKVVLGDRLGVYVAAVFSRVELHNATTFTLAGLAFAVQIYCDFSGYSDIAVGTARVFGVDLMRNFERPFLATSLQDFWRRWHISLSTWLRDYVYIPLGGSRTGITGVNLLLTMVLGGLWHGASWTFVLWGALHGAGLAVERGTRALRDTVWGQLGALKLGRPVVAWGLTFTWVWMTFLVFRAPSVRHLREIFGGFARLEFGLPFIDLLTFTHVALALPIVVLFELGEEGLGVRFHEGLRRLPAPVRWVGWYALLAFIVLFGVQTGSQFIYFRF